MAKKRVIYTLLYAEGGFMLSRNFRLQRAGDVNWLLKNYNFRNVSAYIDELIIVDVSRQNSDRKLFLEVVRKVIDCCFVPVALGGRIEDFETAARFIASGADKVVLNTIFDTSPEAARKIADVYGSQCIVAGVDVRMNKSAEGGYEALIAHGQRAAAQAPRDRIRGLLDNGAGEILLQSIDRDGTGFGFDLDSLRLMDAALDVPLILFGGCGKGSHMLEALRRPEVDAVATANLFNFIGDGLQKARAELLAHGLDLACWNGDEVERLRSSLAPA